MKKATRRPAAPKATRLPAQGRRHREEVPETGAPEWMAAGGETRMASGPSRGTGTSKRKTPIRSHIQRDRQRAFECCESGGMDHRFRLPRPTPADDSSCCTTSLRAGAKGLVRRARSSAVSSIRYGYSKRAHQRSTLARRGGVPSSAGVGLLVPLTSTWMNGLPAASKRSTTLTARCCGLAASRSDMCNPLLLGERPVLVQDARAGWVRVLGGMGPSAGLAGLGRGGLGQLGPDFLPVVGAKVFAGDGAAGGALYGHAALDRRHTRPGRPL